MDFSAPSAVTELCAALRPFIDEHVIPLERELDEAHFRRLVPKLDALREKVKANGWWSPGLPKEMGGMGLPLRHFAHVSEELGRTPLGHYVFNCQAPDISTMELLHTHASAEQQERYLKPLTTGAIRSCFAMTEPDHPGSNPVWMGTIARKDGDHWVLNGRKWFATGFDGSAFTLVMALSDPENPDKHRRASLFLMPSDQPGLRLMRNLPVMGVPGEHWASHAELALEDVRVPLDSVMGGEGNGFKLAQNRLGPGRIHHCMRWIGIAERAFDLMCRRLVSRQLSPGHTLGEQQMPQEWVADSRTEIEAARLMVLRAAWRIDTEGAAAARDDISQIKFFTANMLTRVLDRAIQAHGGLGILDDTPLAFWYRQERAAHIYDGADEVHKSSLARSILKGYARG